MMNHKRKIAAAAPHLEGRYDGWTLDVQEGFITALVSHGSARVAAAVVERHITSAYRLRARDPVFAAAWDAARGLAYDRLRDEAIERAIDGTPQEIWHDGEHVGTRHVRNDRLLMSLMAHLRPEAAAAAPARPHTVPPQPPLTLRHDESAADPVDFQ